MDVISESFWSYHHGRARHLITVLPNVLFQEASGESTSFNIRGITDDTSSIQSTAPRISGLSDGIDIK